jgi:PKHD-type hydroxylase
MSRLNLQTFSPAAQGDATRPERHLDWVVCAERLAAADCDAIVATAREFRAEPAVALGDPYRLRRRAIAHKVLPTERSGWIFDLLLSVAAEANARHYGLALSGITRAPEYCEYRPDNGQFDWHTDYGHEPVSTPRKLTLIVQLSDAAEYAGGRLEVFGVRVDELPTERGSILVLPSFVHHRVTRVTSGVRRVLVAWIAGPPLR